MLRHAVPLTLLGLVLVPDWAAAFGPRWGACYPPVVVTYCPPPIVYGPIYPPPYAVVPAPTYSPPKVHQEPAKQQMANPDLPGPRSVLGDRTEATGRAAVSEPAKKEEVRPIEFTAPSPSSPLANPRPVAPDAAPKPAAPDLKLTVPPTTGAPGGTLDVPQLPSPSLPAAPAAPAKDADGFKIPALVPPLSPPPGPAVPPLAIPTPASDGSPVPKSSTSKSSPLANRPRAEVIPVDGPVPADPKAKRTVGFFNQTDRDVRLTVEGQTITLPKRHAVSAQVPVRFAWRLEDNPPETTEVPTATPGVEVVIRR